MSLSIVILAAGQGTRMKSARPKVIHPLAGRPMSQHVVETSRQLQPDQIILVVGHQSEMVKEAMRGQQLLFVEQNEQLGTGHAVARCLPVLRPGNHVLVLYGDGASGQCGELVGAYCQHSCRCGRNFELHRG